MAVLPDFLEDAPPFTDDDLEALFSWSDREPSDAPVEPVSNEAAADTIVAWASAVPAERWSVTDAPSAEWAMRKYAAADGEIDEAERLAADWIDQVCQWLDRTKRPLERKRAFFEHHLTDYALRRRAEDPRFKTLKLPSGDVPTRSVPARPEVQDDEAFVPWARAEAPALVKAKWSPVAAEVKKAVGFRPVWVETGGAAPIMAEPLEGGQLVALPLSGRVVDLLAYGYLPDADGDFSDLHVEELALLPTTDGKFFVVPGVAEVPETVSASVKPAGRK